MEHAASRLDHLDGLRAVAVLGVLLFHFEVRPFGGGYAGVDIFLSLSGFLITRNIAHDLLVKKSFSLRSFYSRRFFRLLPASTLTIAMTAAITLRIMSPELAEATLKSARAAMLFQANVFFHGSSGYFEDAPDRKPLLHMWSLSLEEQFYFLWAPLLVLLASLPTPHRTLPAATLVLFVASLTTAIMTQKFYPSFVFFELPPRIFQFAAGAFLSFFPSLARAAAGSAGPKPEAESGESGEAGELELDMDGVPREEVADKLTEGDAEVWCETSSVTSALLTELGRGSNYLSIAALAVIIASFVLLPPGAPAVHMLPTTLATCALIATPQSLLSRHVLSSRLSRHLGALSYSLYLVHWPLYVLGKYVVAARFSISYPSPAALFGLSFVLAWLLKWLVEDPVRDSGNVALRRRFGAAAIVTLLAACWAAESLDAKALAGEAVASQRESMDGLAPGNVFAECKTLIKRITLDTPSRMQFIHLYIGPSETPDSRYVFFGNSYTGHLMLSIARVAQRRRETFMVTFRGSCDFLGRTTPGFMPVCNNARDAFWKLVDELPGKRHLVIANSWHFSKDTVEKTVLELVRDVRRAGHDISLIGRPPIPPREMRAFFDCADMERRRGTVDEGDGGRDANSSVTESGSTGGNATAAGTTTKSGVREARQCMNISEGFCPHWRSSADLDMALAIEQHKLNVSFLDWKRTLCTKVPTDDCTFGMRCRWPVHTASARFEVGFKRDMFHLSQVGSYYLGDALDEFLFGDGSGR